MSAVTRVAKRLVIGSPVRSDKVGHTLLPKRLALPIFASDALSSVAYATQEILLVLTLAGTAYLFLAPWLAAVVVILLLTVVASYRQLVVAYPTGGGDYEVATKNIGRQAGVVVASALLVDYVMTVAVSVSSGVDNIISAIPSLHSHRVEMALLFVALLTAANLRGVREAGTAFAIPTYAFAVGVGIMILTGVFRTIVGDAPVAESAKYHIDAHAGYGNMGALALIFFALRAFSSGCTALTGVEAIANGVPAFKKPKADNARKTLVMMGLLACGMFSGITVLAVIAKVRVAAHACDLEGFANCSNAPQKTVIAQLASSIFGGDHSVGFFYIQAATALILVLAANTAFNGFPLLGSILAQDRNLPRQLHTRGDRLVFSNGILMLAIVAGSLIFIYGADVTRLIQLYIIGVFTSFTLGQSGMVRHWNRLLRTERDQAVRRRIMRSRAINAFGASLTGLVLIIVTITKFTKGAYLVLIAMPILYAGMRGIYKHYARVGAELATDPDDTSGLVLPARNHVVVLVSKLHKPTLRALGLRAGYPPGHADRTHRERRRRGDQGTARGVGAARVAGQADRVGIAVPRGDDADRQVRQGHSQDEPERRGQRVHSGVRGGPLVGESAAQPVRAAAEGPAAVPARRDGDQRSLAVGFVAGARSTADAAHLPRRDSGIAPRRGRVAAPSARSN